MKKCCLAFLAVITGLCFHSSVSAQEIGFPFGATYNNLAYVPTPRDSSAEAIVLQEFGEARFENAGDYSLIFEYHVRIKILTKDGLKYADVEIPLRKDESREELLRYVKASSFNMENGSMKETPLEMKNVFYEKTNKYVNLKKFAIPNVRVGSVIEYVYVMEMPFIFNFRSWEFQSEIPKLSSEFWARIPGNYLYNISLTGYLKLSKNESDIIKECYTPGGHKADCSLNKYAMKNIPAFKEEEYMTAKSDHLSSVNFELSEIRYFDGRVNRVTKEWKDADEELRRHPDFGVQLRKGKDIADQIKPLIAGTVDPLQKAKKVYNFIRDWYRWNGHYSKYSETGVKKAFENKSGNVGDINLSLIAALKYAGLDVDPLILSTRENGLPIEIYPVISDFNYVVAKVNIGDEYYLADATDDFIPFGILPIRCINGKGRVLGEKESSWLELKPVERSKNTTLVALKMDNNGVVRGKIETKYIGYDAIQKRKEINSFSNHAEYFRKLDEGIESLEIKTSKLVNLDSIEQPLLQKLEVEFDLLGGVAANNFLFNPLVISQRWKENPFKSDERLYPVDFGAPIEHTIAFSLEYPPQFELAEIPEKIALSLPASGGRFVYEVQNIDNKLVLNTSVAINRTVYTANDYHYLKELFSRMIHAYQQDLLFKKKP
jgi:transglutaminase-like putative cysteine protease